MFRLGHEKFECTPVIKFYIGMVVLILAFTVTFYLYSPAEKALKAIEAGDYEKAIKITNFSSKFFPFSSKWYSLRGYAKFQLGDYESAIKDYDKAYSLETDEYKMMNFDNKIFIRYYLKDYNTALEDFDREISNSKNDLEKDSFLWDKAQFLYNIAKYDKALEIYNDLLLKSDQDRIYLLKTRLYFERGQIYQKLGMEDLANADFEKAKNSQLLFENPIPEPILLLDNEI
ncbi:tetratricopeptide repeat protein [bacterium]|nr:tetratricopeptide repeat protein [bacterium]